MRPFDEVDERHSLTAREREILGALIAKPLPFNERRTLPNEYRSLVQKGLAFWSFNLVTATPKGEQVHERVA